MKEENRRVFVADDGAVFDTQAGCEAYEKEIADRKKRTTYWRVTHKPDLTEGRGYYGVLYLEVYGPMYGAEAWVRDWCHRELGRPLEFVQGCSPMENWILRNIDRDQFFKPFGSKVGDYEYKPASMRLVVGPKSTGLIQEQTP